MVFWDNLPTLVVVHILSYLSRPDRLSVSLVCRQWLIAFRSPSLWRSLRCDFSLGPGSPRPAKAARFASNFGQYLRHLHITCDWLSASRCCRVGQAVIRLLEALQNRANLTHLSLRRFRFELNWKKYQDWRQRTIDAICHFLQTQDHLIFVDLTEMDLCNAEAVQLLTAMSESCAASLQHLELKDFLAVRQDVCSKDSYSDVMSSWQTLQCLSINYSALDANHLLAIARNSRCRFDRLFLRCRKTDNHAHAIPALVWKQVVDLSAKLKVYWSLERIPAFRELEPLLPYSVPLHSLHYWTGYSERDEIWQLPCFLRYLGQHFGPHLDSLNLEIEDNLEPIDEELLGLIGCCHVLQHLEIVATLNVQFVDKLCTTIEEKKELKTLHLSLCNLQQTEYEALQTIEQKHQSLIASKGIGFRCTVNWVH